MNKGYSDLFLRNTVKENGTMLSVIPQRSKESLPSKRLKTFLLAKIPNGMTKEL